MDRLTRKLIEADKIRRAAERKEREENVRLSYQRGYSHGAAKTERSARVTVPSIAVSQLVERAAEAWARDLARAMRESEVRGPLYAVCREVCDIFMNGMMPITQDGISVVSRELLAEQALELSVTIPEVRLSRRLSRIEIATLR